MHCWELGGGACFAVATVCLQCGQHLPALMDIKKMTYFSPNCASVCLSKWKQCIPIFDWHVGQTDVMCTDSPLYRYSANIRNPKVTQGEVLRECNGVFRNSNTWCWNPNFNFQCLCSSNWVKENILTQSWPKRDEFFTAKIGLKSFSVFVNLNFEG